MNTVTKLACLFLLSRSLFLSPAILAQGPITPPGAPAPTMKTLTQVEPRTAIATLPFTISQPGSYYLTQNLTGVAGQSGITISTSNVTIDLNGFALRGVAGSLHGITEPGALRRNIAIRNGVISDWGSRGINGINFTNSQFQNLQVSGNGGEGIASGSGSAVRDCTVEENGNHGISAGSGASISGCTARSNALTGIATGGRSTITGCTAAGNSTGISLGFGSLVSDCAAVGNAGTGISAGGSNNTITRSTASENGRGILVASAATVAECTASFNVGHGIQVESGSSITGNTCSSNGVTGNGAGIHFTGDGVRIEGNNCYDNDWGIQGVADTNSFIVRNSGKSNGAGPLFGGPSGNFDFPASNTFGPIIVVSGDMAALPAASHPWANISY